MKRFKNRKLTRTQSRRDRFYTDTGLEKHTEIWATDVLDMTVNGAEFADHLDDYFYEVIDLTRDIHKIAQKAIAKVNTFDTEQDLSEKDVVEMLTKYLSTEGPWGEKKQARFWAEAIVTLRHFI